LTFAYLREKGKEKEENQNKNSNKKQEQKQEQDVNALITLILDMLGKFAKRFGESGRQTFSMHY